MISNALLSATPHPPDNPLPGHRPRVIAGEEARGGRKSSKEKDHVHLNIKASSGNNGPTRWFHPRRMRMRDIDCRKHMESHESGDAAWQGDNCMRFQASCQSALLHLETDQTRQYLLPFPACKMASLVPIADDSDDDHEKKAASVSSEGSDEDNASLSDRSESIALSGQGLEEESTTVLLRGDKNTSGGDPFAAWSELNSDSGDDMSEMADDLSEMVANRNPSSPKPLPDRVSVNISIDGVPDARRRRPSYDDGSMNLPPTKRSSHHNGRHANMTAYLCTRKNHQTFMFEKVYVPRCEELGVQLNSGIRRILLNTSSCICSVESLNLSNLLIGDRGIRAVTPLLKTCKRLKNLNLGGNKIRDQGFKDFLMTVRDPEVCSSLAVLDVSKNPISSNSASDLASLMNCRRNLLIVGIVGTDMPVARRQTLLRRCLNTFSQAATDDMFLAWQLARPGSGFADSEAWVQCASIVERLCSREQLAQCIDLVAKCKAGGSISRSSDTPTPLPPIQVVESRSSSKSLSEKLASSFRKG